MKRAQNSVLMSVALAAMLGCSGSGNGGGSAGMGGAMPDPDMGETMADATVDMTVDMMAAVPSLETTPTEFEVPMLGEGQRVVREMQLGNTGERDINITAFTLMVTDGSAALSYGPRQLIGITPMGTDSFPYPITIATGESLTIFLEYTLGAGEPGGEITITGDFQGETLSLPISALASVGQIGLEPTSIDFGRVRAGTTVQQTLTVTNTGQSRLNILEIEKDLNVYYSLSIGDVDPEMDPTVFADPDADGEVGLAPGASFPIEITFTPTRESIEQSVVIIRTDDPVTPEARVPLIANGEPGCIQVSHEELEWAGPVQVWTESPTVSVTNCGEGNLVIDRIGMVPGTDAFELLGAALPDFPAVMPAGAEPLQFSVNYGPPYPRRYRGQVEILSNDPNQPTININLRASTPCNDDSECPEGYLCQDNSCEQMMME